MDGIRTACYTLITTAIIMLGWLRGWLGPRQVLRFDRTLPWCEDFTGKAYRGENGWTPHQRVLMLECCDCGLTHCTVAGHSGTPVRPKDYRYPLRLGANAWTKPLPALGAEVRYLFTHCGYQSDHFQEASDGNR